jgi:YVTN family beta-propeller protein
MSVSFDSNGTRAFISHLRSPRLVSIDLNSLRLGEKVNTGPAAGVLADPNSRRIFVALATQNRLGLFDPAIGAEIGSVAVGIDPYSLALDVDREKIYVVNRGSDNITVVDKNTRRVRTEIPTTKRPYGIAIVR